MLLEHLLLVASNLPDGISFPRRRWPSDRREGVDIDLHPGKNFLNHPVFMVQPKDIYGSEMSEVSEITVGVTIQI